MQATVKPTQNNMDRSGSHDHVNDRMAQRFNLFGWRTVTLLICLLVLMGSGTSVAQTMPHPTNAAAPSDAQKAFEKMKALAGSWQGTIAGKSINITIRLTSSGTTILHEATGAGLADHEITVIYLDGDRLLATHYCDAGNRPRWEGKMSPDAKTIEFGFLDVAGNTQRGFAKSTVFTMIDADHHGVELTYMMPDGKPLLARGEFQRTK
jgi:hypothetical protein